MELYMQASLYKIHLKSIIKICSIGLLGYIPLFLILTLSVLMRDKQPVGPLGQLQEVSWVEVLYINFYLLLFAIFNLVVVVIGIWCWSRFFEIKVSHR